MCRVHAIECDDEVFFSQMKYYCLLTDLSVKQKHRLSSETATLLSYFYGIMFRFNNGKINLEFSKNGFFLDILCGKNIPVRTFNI
jgi:hypothetical protein